jgi:hypothetical protein
VNDNELAAYALLAARLHLNPNGQQSRLPINVKAGTLLAQISDDSDYFRRIET